MVQLYPLPSVLLTLLFSLPHVHADSGPYWIKAVKGHRVSQLCMRRGISLTGAVLGGCPMVILQIPVWLLTSAVWVSLSPLLSLWSLLPSYQAIPEPQISPVPPSSPRALQTSRKHFTFLEFGSPKSSPTFSQTPLPSIPQVLPYFAPFWWNSPTLSKNLP